MSEKKSRGTERFRAWTCILYPESAAEDWRDVLNNYHIPWCCSPLHDMDCDADGCLKKPHYHLLIVFDGKKGYAQVKEITDALHGTSPQNCASIKGLVRYMAHLDNPEKFQYKAADIECHGLDISSYLESCGARYDMMADIVGFVIDNDILEMEDVVIYAMQYRRKDWWPFLCDSNCILLQSFLSSRRHRRRDERSKRHGQG